MHYHVNMGCPRNGMSGWGFNIELFHGWRELVAKSEINQATVDHIVSKVARQWLDAHGYGQMHDPDADPFEVWKEEKMGKVIKLGPNARHLYEPHCINVRWGTWGPEHITVPGNACGLDMDFHGHDPMGETLVPHNVDCIFQAHLLLTVFSWFAQSLVLEERMRTR